MVSDATMALILSPDPMPVEVMAAAEVAGVGVVVAAGDAAPDIVELICMPVPFQIANVSARWAKT